MGEEVLTSTQIIKGLRKKLREKEKQKEEWKRRALEAEKIVEYIAEVIDK